VIACQSIEKQ
jgi:hypothetical protein